MIITGYNPLTDHLEKTNLAQDYAAGVTSIITRDTNNFANGDRIMLGEMGRERTEIATINAAISSDGITLGVVATKYPHSTDDPVYQLKYDQIEFFRSTTTVGGTYTILSGGTVNVDVDNADKETRFNDTGGLSSYFYKIKYYNSVTATESDFSDPIAATGYTRGQVGAIVNDFLTEVNDLEQKYMTVPEIISLMNEVNDDLTTQSRRPYRFQKTSAVLDIVASNDRVELPSDIWKFDRIMYNYTYANDNRKDLIRVVTMQEIEYLKYDQTAATDDNLQYVAIDDTTSELVLYPVPNTSQSDVFQIYYWSTMPTYDSLGDAIATPTPRIYKLFLMSRFYRNRAVKEQQFLTISDRFSQEYGTEIVKLQRINKLDIGTPPGMRPDLNRSRGLRKY